MLKCWEKNSLRLTSHCSTNITAFRGACVYSQRPQRILCHAQKLLAIFSSDKSIYPLPPQLKATSDKLPHHINMIFMIAPPHDSLEFLIPFYYKLYVCQVSHTLPATSKAGEIGQPQFSWVIPRCRFQGRYLNTPQKLTVLLLKMDGRRQGLFFKDYLKSLSFRAITLR